MRIGPLGTDDPYPVSLALAGDTLLVLCELSGDDESESNSTTSTCTTIKLGRFCANFHWQAKGWNDDPTNGTMAVQGDMLYVTCKRNSSVDEYRWRDGTLMRRFGGRDQPLSFCSPFGVAIRGKTMYVSEVDGRQIQVIRLPDDDSAEPEILQVIPSPDGEELGGLCVNGDRLWCMGPKQPRVTRDTYVPKAPFRSLLRVNIPSKVAAASRPAPARELGARLLERARTRPAHASAARFP